MVFSEVELIISVQKYAVLYDKSNWKEWINVWNVF